VGAKCNVGLGATDIYSSRDEMRTYHSSLEHEEKPDRGQAQPRSLEERRRFDSEEKQKQRFIFASTIADLEDQDCNLLE